MKNKLEFDFRLLENNEVVVLDIETTGFTPLKGGRIIEIGAVKIVSGKIISEFTTFINPDIKIPNKITEITGITNEMVLKSPKISEVLHEFHKFIGNSLIVAHNSEFDWNRFLLYFFEKIGLFPKNKVVDTQVLSKLTYPKEKKHNLAVLCERLGIEVCGHHRALNDAKMTAKAYLKLCELNRDSFSKNQIGFDLIDKDEVVEITPKFDCKIVRVKYWSKSNTKRLLFSRHYVTMRNGKCYGTVYFDIPSKTWYNKDYISDIDFDVVERKVLNFLGLKNRSELCNYRN